MHFEVASLICKKKLHVATGALVIEAAPDGLLLLEADTPDRAKVEHRVIRQRVLRKRSFVCAFPVHGHRVPEHRHAKGLRCLRQEDLVTRERSDNVARQARPLDGIASTDGRNRRPGITRRCVCRLDGGVR